MMCKDCGCYLILGYNWYESYRNKNMYRCSFCSNVRKRNSVADKKYIKNKTERWKQRLTSLKKNGCSMCGYNECTEALAFHHIDPKEKRFPVNNSCYTYSDESIEKEIKKCILLCNRCHQELHARGREK